MGISHGTCKRILANNCRGNNLNNSIKQVAFRRGDTEGQGKESI